MVPTPPWGRDRTEACAHLAIRSIDFSRTATRPGTVGHQRCHVRSDAEESTMKRRLVSGVVLGFAAVAFAVALRPLADRTDVDGPARPAKVVQADGIMLSLDRTP